MKLRSVLKSGDSKASVSKKGWRYGIFRLGVVGILFILKLVIFQ